MRGPGDDACAPASSAAARDEGGASLGRVLVLGEALVDVVVDAHGSAREHVGGSPLNVALGLRRLGHDVDFATTLGADARGDRIRAILVNAGVTLVPGSVTTDRTSTALARLDASGTATYEFDLHFDLPAVPSAARAGHAHTGSIGAVLAPGAASVREALDAVRTAGTVSYDPNIRPSVMGTSPDLRERVEDLIGRCDLVKASSEDVDHLYPGAGVAEILARWCSLGASLAVVTLGPGGAVLRTRTSPSLVTRPAVPARVVDTVGAGDSFMSGLLSGLLDGGLIGSSAAGERLASAGADDVRAAVDRALAASAVTVGRAGAYAPAREDLR